MKLYTIQVIGANPARHRGVLGADDAEALFKAQQRHQAAGFPVAGHQFTITHSQLVVCGSVTESDPSTLYPLALTDGMLAEIEAALLDRIGHLEGRVDLLGYGKPDHSVVRAHRVHLQQAREALAQVEKA